MLWTFFCNYHPATLVYSSLVVWYHSASQQRVYLVAKSSLQVWIRVAEPFLLNNQDSWNLCKPVREVIKWLGSNVHSYCAVVCSSVTLNQPNYSVCSTGWLIYFIQLLSESFASIQRFSSVTTNHEWMLETWIIWLLEFMKNICIALFNEIKIN